MGKRKRSDTTGADNGQSVERKKRRKSGHRTPELLNGPAPENRLSQPQGTVNRGGAVAQSMSIGEPPPGLSKGQRKRWRKRQKRSTTGLEEPSASTPSDVARSTAVTSAFPTKKKLGSIVEATPALDRSILRHYSVTKLISRPEKCWYDYEDSTPVTVGPILQAQSASSGGLGSRSSQYQRGEATSKQVFGQAASDSSSSESEDYESSSEQQGPKLLPSPKFVRKQHDELAAKLSAQVKPQSAFPQSISESVSEKPSYVRHNLDSFLARSFNTRNVTTGTLVPMPSLGHKPSNVPSYGGNLDAKASFKQFTAFLQGEDSEDDDDESEESDMSDSRSRSKDAVVEQSDEARRLNDQEAEQRSGDSQPSSESGPEEQTVGAAAQETTQEAVVAVNEAVVTPTRELSPYAVTRNESVNQDPSPFSSAESRSHHRSTSSWPANVGMKRSVSSSPRKLISSSSNRATVFSRLTGSTGDTTVEPGLPFSSPRSDGEVSEDLYQTIDEISKDVFSETRPLPASKPPESPDPESLVDLGKELMTFTSSDRPVTRSLRNSNGNKLSQGRPFRQPASDLAFYGDDNTTFSWSDRPITRSMKIIEDEHFDGAIPFSLEQPIVCYSAPTSELQASVPLVLETYVEVSTTTRSDYVTSEIAPSHSNDEASQTSLSELSRSPTPPSEIDIPTLFLSAIEDSLQKVDEEPEPTVVAEESEDDTPLAKKRRMTGMTSKHFTPVKQKPRKRKSERIASKIETESSIVEPSTAAVDSSTIPDGPYIPTSTRSSTRAQRKGTGKKSTYFTPTKAPLDPNIIDRVDFYNTTAGSRGKKGRRVPAGTSTRPVPPISSERFGIIQEKLWQEPFWLLIAVTFLNKTTGRAAAPVFWDLKARYPTAEALAAAPQEELETTVWHLGLQTQRSKRLIKIAQAWVDAPPKPGVRWRTLHYPCKGDGKELKPAELVEADAEDCVGALEIGNIPGCGPYAWDSWRMFCRDVLRGVAEDYNGKAAMSEDFMPEWKRVLPLDKELRACLRWMWLREGWKWDCETGEKREATEEEMEKAVVGEMDFDDPQERKFAAQAAGVPVETPVHDADDREPAAVAIGQITEISRPQTPPRQPLSSKVVDAPFLSPATLAVRRSARLMDSATIRAQYGQSLSYYIEHETDQE